MMKPSLQLKLGQTLTMTPQLQQAIRLLQMPALELPAASNALGLFKRYLRRGHHHQAPTHQASPPCS
jgi:hypothetical protein